MPALNIPPTAAQLDAKKEIIISIGKMILFVFMRFNFRVN